LKADHVEHTYMKSNKH